MEKEEINQENIKVLAEELRGAQFVKNSRPHQYEHKHFMLIESIAEYLITRDYKEESKEGEENVESSKEDCRCSS